MAKIILGLILTLTLANSACLSSLATSSGLSSFLSGVFEGLQANPNFPSPCLRKFKNVGVDFADMMTNLKDVFIDKEPSLYFDAVSNFANLFDDLDDSVALCQLDLITNQLANLFTPQEASAIALRISSNSVILIGDWQGFATNVGTNNQLAGQYFGKFLSIIFDYSI